MAQPIFPLVNRILHGRLAEILAEYRAEGLTFENIARRFGTDHAVDVTSETVRKWCHSVGAADKDSAA